MLGPLQVSSIHHFYLHLHTPKYYTVCEKEDLEGVKRSISCLCCACALIIGLMVSDFSDHYRTTNQLDQDEVHDDPFYGASCCSV